MPARQRRLKSQSPALERAGSAPPQEDVVELGYPHMYDEDASLTFLFKPHTLSGLCLLLLGLVFTAFKEDHIIDVGLNSTQKGLIAGILVFLLFSMMQLPDGPFFRPHPAAWRVVKGASILYLLLLVFLLFQTREEAHMLIRSIDPSHKPNPLGEREYGADCRVYTPEQDSMFQNIKDTVLDEFMIAHAVGWFGKMLMIRDYTLCWVLSIGFELLEITFAHMLPNFSECWWDQVILDVLVCNLLGMYCGKLALRWLDGKEYDWAGFHTIKTVRGRMKRTAQQFTPQSWTSFDWGVLSSFKRFFAVTVMVVGIEMCELNAFFLKSVLDLKPSHWLNLLRLGLWLCMGCVGLREYYQFVADKSCKKMGTQIWIATAVLITEVLICIKYGAGMYPKPMPQHVIVMWTVIFTVLIGYCVHEFVYKRWTTREDFVAMLVAESKDVLTNFI